MRIINLDNEYKAENPSILAMGMFDGLHRGHVALIEKTVELKASYEVDAALLTFITSPKAIFSDGYTGNILSDEVRFELMSELGVDICYLLESSKEIFDMTPEQFFKEFILKSLNPKCIVVGFNYTFGKNKAGNVSVLKSLCEEYDIDVHILDPVCHDGELISSTGIKTAIASSRFAEASALLGRDYEVIANITRTATKVIATCDKDVILPSPGFYEANISGAECKCEVKPDGQIEVDSKTLLVGIVAIKFIAQ